ncbi:hypothetical protein SAMN05192545_2907 [Maribacter dokdonensis]|uniref:Uncharacterized protein n=1 Tax=Maribacter dokdonensis TaxID=320912 RepID=A0ABY0UTN9_9FLAO|nr:hypothetical protein [Maribacter dokdonensis]SDT16096.1 hypothetical protein SAMN05192545_2907 [Maribacter dokdonensis]
MEKIIFGHIDVGMLVLFVLGLLCLFFYAWKNNEDIKKGYSTKRYMRISLPNTLFHIFGSVSVFMLLHELSEVLIDNLIPQLKGSGTYHMTLSFLSGCFGSVLVAWVFEYVRKKQNTIDTNIKHVHDENCEH